MTSGSNVDADVSCDSERAPHPRLSPCPRRSMATTSTAAATEDAFSAARLANSSATPPHVSAVYGHPCNRKHTGAPSGVLDVVDGDDDASFEYTRNVPRVPTSTSRARRKHSRQCRVSTSSLAVALAESSADSDSDSDSASSSSASLARGGRRSNPRVDRGRFEVEMDAHGAFVHAGLGARAFNATSTSCVASASASASTRGVMCGARTSCFISIHFNRFVTSSRRLARCRRRKRLDARFERDDVTRRHDGDSRSRRRDDGARR